jgi:thiosulfate dehydrogenase [quinone] large subunit
MLLLLFYYLAHPALPSLPQGPSEGSYWIVNKNVVEMATLFVIYQFPFASAFGLEGLFARNKEVTTAGTPSKEGTVKTVASKEAKPIN